MHDQIIILVLFLEILDLSYTTTLGSNKLIQDICDTLQDNNGFQSEEDRQWEIICQELIHSKDEHQNIRKARDIISDIEKEDDATPNKQLRKGVGGGRGGGGSRGGGIFRGGGSIISGGGSNSGSRTSFSGTRYINTRTGQTIPRPTNSQWSRSQLIFLPIATRYFHRSYPSSSRYTTPVASSNTYYYCTSDTDLSTEIQCSSVEGDEQCCEDQDTQQAFCCGGDVPDYIIQDMNQATKTIARVFYTLAAVALCMHLFMRRFRR